MAEQAYAYVTLIPVAKGFQSQVAKQLSGVGGATGSIGAQAGKSFSGGFGGALKGLLGPLTATLSTVAVANFAKSAVSAASAFSAEFEGVNQTFGDAAKSVQAFADQAAYSAGISETAALQAAKNFGGFASAAGLAGEQAATFSTSLVQAAGDLASFNDVPVDQALSAIQSGLAGETEPLRRFRIFLDEATLSAQAAEMGFGDTFSTLSQGEKTLVRQTAIMEQMGVQAGDFEKYAGTYGNALKTVQAQFQELQADVGQALLPALEALLPALIPIIEQAAPILLQLFEALSPAIQAVTDNIGPLFEALTPLFDALNMIIEALGPIIAELLPVWVDLIGMITPLILQLVEAFLPLVAKLLPSFMELIEAIMPVLSIVADILSTLVVPALELMGNILSDVLIGAMDLLTQGFNNLKSVLEPVWNFLKPMIEGLLALAGIKPASLNKTVKVGFKDVTAPGAFGLPGQTASAASVLGLTTPSITTPKAKGKGTAKTDTRKQVKDAIQSTRKALSAARKEYDKAVEKANAQFAEREGEILEDYNIAVARATIQRDQDLANALKDNTKRVSEIQKDFAQRLDDIVQQSMNRLRDAYKSAVELNVATIFDSDVVAGSIDGTIEMMREKLAASRQLLANAAALAAAGFSQTFIEQVVGAGTDVGNELATSILNATPEQRAEMQALFGAIEKEASTGMDGLAKTIYEKNGLATDELKNLYAQTQSDLITALAEQEVAYQEQMSSIMVRFNEAIVEAANTRDSALQEAQKDLQDNLKQANEAWLEDLNKIEEAYKQKIAGMKSMSKSMTDEISRLKAEVSLAQANATNAAGAITTTPGFRYLVRPMAEGGLVTGPLNALVGEAGPEVVIPLDRFENMMGMSQGGGAAINYYAAPNQSLDSEQELFTAMKRAKVVVGW